MYCMRENWFFFNLLLQTTRTDILAILLKFLWIIQELRLQILTTWLLKNREKRMTSIYFYYHLIWVKSFSYLQLHHHSNFFIIIIKHNLIFNLVLVWELGVRNRGHHNFLFFEEVLFIKLKKYIFFQDWLLQFSINFEIISW